MKKQRILLIITFSYLKKDGGGVESWLQKFLCNAHLISIKYQKIIVIGLDDGKPSIANDDFKSNIFFKLLKVRISSSLLIMPKFLKLVGKIVKSYKKERIDIVFIGSTYASYPVLFLKSNELIKKYVWLRSFFPKEIYSTGMKKFRKFFLWLEHRCLKQADKIIANGIDTKNKYEKTYLDLPQIISIPNGIDKRLVMENKAPLTQEVVKIAFVGRLERIKGFDSFCESIRLINLDKQKKEFDFYIIGFGNLQRDAEKLAKEYTNVHYLGKMNNRDVYIFLSAMDCSVNLSVFSKVLGGAGLSNSLIEAIFSKNLIIAWSNEIFSQYLSEKEAILVTQGDIKELETAYLSILENREKFIKKINAAYEKTKVYDFEHHMSLFSKVMNGEI